jgi:hypothetical protein
MNSLSIIAPYKYEGMWVFDDEQAGLIKEPFVEGADTMIDAMIADIADADTGFRIIFSASAFPGYQHKLEWVRPELSGNIYRSAELGMEGWLCPALFKYFSAAPAVIYLKVEAKQPAAQAGKTL